MIKENAYTIDITFYGLLALFSVAMIGLRLIGAVDWPWWVVLMPLYVPIGIVMLFFILGMLAIGVLYVCGSKSRLKITKAIDGNKK